MNLYRLVGFIVGWWVIEFKQKTHDDQDRNRSPHR